MVANTWEKGSVFKGKLPHTGHSDAVSTWKEGQLAKIASETST